MSEKQEFTVSGHKVELDKKTVEGKLATIQAEPFDLVYVHVDHKDFPVKQAFAEATGLIKSQFTQDAVRVLGRVGFDAKEQKEQDEEKGVEASPRMPEFRFSARPK